ncbi:hypothetical protein V8F06_007379 [Rhypophila decipiens]
MTGSELRRARRKVISIKIYILQVVSVQQSRNSVRRNDKGRRGGGQKIREGSGAGGEKRHREILEGPRLRTCKEPQFTATRRIFKTGEERRILSRSNRPAKNAKYQPPRTKPLGPSTRALQLRVRGEPRNAGAASGGAGKIKSGSYRRVTQAHSSHTVKCRARNPSSKPERQSADEAVQALIRPNSVLLSFLRTLSTGHDLGANPRPRSLGLGEPEVIGDSQIDNCHPLWLLFDTLPLSTNVCSWSADLIAREKGPKKDQSSVTTSDLENRNLATKQPRPKLKTQHCGTPVSRQATLANQTTRPSPSVFVPHAITNKVVHFPPD